MADVICQYLTPPDDNSQQSKENTSEAGDSLSSPFVLDVERMGRFFVLGAFWVAPVTHFWYNTLSTRIVPGARTRLKIAQRLIIDQFVMAPPFVCSFLAGLWMLEGQSFDNIVKSLQDVALDTIQANWTLWIPAQVINFSFVPLNYQVLYSNIVALLWNVYISYVSAEESKKTKQHQKTDNE